MNLPNKLSMLRIFLVPIIVALLLYSANFPFYGDLTALIIFSAAALTDKYDGYYARKYNMITQLGKILDPLADKLLISGALVAFVDLGKISAWVALVIIGRELAVTGLRVVAAGQGIIIPANMWGKWKTTIQIITIIALIIDPILFNLPSVLITSLVWAAVLITIYSGYVYFASADVDYS
ncbi:MULTISPECIES: CDP-diacylglycerol--glycerol-3-phosphate 3-phosphatidyltransferase [unclassified Halanaerobium]|uniref:CDP-diacylglycerol--glycerol-3-phosphate 3-phosphatidyltransferase n=1 Tax=unclassified Halanaerobium TaxID=2641197 RepID=UPI000DF219CB|nr:MULTISPECIES: CDP-diacylglycerol--glycerol-3-phosphate 3-phosphatidyltransferase [unclassified Halanaerobium]RCW51518.1 CDP-diacylglycerol--glycerol-3-phosphate 3-phosphatidyltransferase [Halanaerobium sp. MA284_MarDTE_T2]RCW89306.1 CDP-diacylglycerol--glycerol-3-phosphate 3-phosphatidyltransferase [Halanaerobium sp. DL-01]